MKNFINHPLPVVLAVCLILAGLMAGTGCSTETDSPTLTRTATVTSTVTTNPGRTSYDLVMDACVICHRMQTPGIVEQFSYSVMAAQGNTCFDCHGVEQGYPGAEEHNGFYRVVQPTPAICGSQDCHPIELEQYYQSRHSLPAYVAMRGTADLSAEHLAMYQSIPEGSFAPDKARNAIYVLEGPDVTPFTCEQCHNIGQPNIDGSVGKCQDCHLRHVFSLEQARKPETCNACHIGPDHPQWEIYQESGHGIAYATEGHYWNWDAPSDDITVADMPAPTCAICHQSAFGGVEASHDMGERLTWYLFSSISERRPDWQDNQQRMQSICGQCHNDNFITDFYTDADKLVEAVNAWVAESNDIIAPLKEQGLLTAAEFDEPIDFVYFDLWHHWGRTTKFGAWMNGADYSQWHGAYEVLRDLAELRSLTAEKLAKME